MELYANLRIIRKHFMLVLLTTLVATLSALAVDRLHHASTIYVASEVLALNPSVANHALIAAAPNNATGNGNANSGQSATTIDLLTLVGTYDAEFTSETFAASVIKQFHLKMTPAELAAATSTALEPGTVLYKISVTGTDPRLIEKAAYDLAQGFLIADKQSADAQAREATQQIIAPPVDSSVTNQLVAASTAFWTRRIAYLQGKMLAVLKNKTLNPNQQYTQFVALQTSLADAETSQSTSYATVTQVRQAAQIPAAIDFTPIPASVVSRSALVRNMVLFAALGGLIVGIALALLREYLDSSLRSAEEAAETLSLPILATVGHFRRRAMGRLGRLPLLGSLVIALDRRGVALLPGGRRAERALVTLTGPFETGTEAFRNLRTGLLFSDVVHKVRTIVVTSPLPNEGKSTVAANLAIVMAQAGQHVILVDADMRRPTQHTLFGLSNTRGLSSLYLEDETADLRVAVSSALQPTSVGNLRLLDAGHVAPNPAELLASQRTPLLIAALQAQADVVIFDTPAMALLTDAVILASLADGTVMVVRAYATRRDFVMTALAKLGGVNARVLGVVLNMADEPGSRYGQYYQKSQRRALKVAAAAVSNTKAAMTLRSVNGASPAQPRAANGQEARLHTMDASAVEQRVADGQEARKSSILHTVSASAFESRVTDGQEASKSLIHPTSGRRGE